MSLNLKSGRVDMSHGSGGRAMAQLIDELFLRHFDNRWLRQGNDGALCQLKGRRLVVSTDSYVISPLFFPGGDIGSLAVHGSVNDVAMSGGVARYLSAAFILEEGLPLADLERVVVSMARAAADAGVAIVCGDTKVVERGKGDGIFITTTAMGEAFEGVDISAGRARPGDAILVSGSMGDHGVAILSQRQNLRFDTTLVSDSAPLNGLVAEMVAAVPTIRCLRDPTRGGLATSLNELAQQSGVGMAIVESAIPVKSQVAAACELLGLDPLYIANEGKLVAISPASEADTLLAAMRRHPLGREAAIIGQVTARTVPPVEMETRLGGRRVVDRLVGEPLPRIC